MGRAIRGMLWLVLAAGLALLVGLCARYYTADEGPVELKYDDGTTEVHNAPREDDSGGQCAVMFTPSFYPARLKEVSFFVTKLGRPKTKFRVRVYKGGGENGGPGTSLLQAEVFASAEGANEWVKVDLSSRNITIDSGDFFVAMEWATAAGKEGDMAQHLGTDRSSPDGRSWWKWAKKEQWQPIERIGTGGMRDLMIRATVVSLPK